MPFVNVYEVGRSYGGPEEGGWWFDTGCPVESYVVGVAATHLRLDRVDDGFTYPPALDFDAVREAAERAAAEVLRDALREEYPRTNRRSSVLGGEDWEVAIEDHPGKAYPEERPHYE